MKQDRPIAHVSEDGRIHLFDEHLWGTAKLAERLAAEFGCAEWGGWRGCSVQSGNLETAYKHV